MAKLKTSLTGAKVIQSKPKNTSQGNSRNTRLSATPSRPKRRRYRGQGK